MTIGTVINTFNVTEVPRRLVGLLVFKTSAAVTSRWVGSIPMHFRHNLMK